MVPLFHPSLAHDERHIDWWARFMRQAASPNSVEAIERIWQQIDIRRILPTIQVPTLVMHRTDDQVEVIEAGRDVAVRIPASRFLELPGGDDEPWGADQDTVLDEVEQFLTGRRHVQDVDRVLATVLFTDIVGSTELAARLGDTAWKELLASHDERARAEIKRHRGIYVDSTGDGLLATFDGPARAVRCAQAIGEALRPLGMQIRAGCHTGEIELAGTAVQRDRGTYRREGCFAGRELGGVDISHSEGPGGGLWARLLGRRRARAEGCPRPLAPLPSRELMHGDTAVAGAGGN